MTIDNRVVNNIRLLSCAMISNAKSGHSGMALGAAPIMYALYGKQMNILPNQPNNFLRDRFVLSAGHGSSLLYATLYSLGFPITKNQLLNFRKTDGLPGHPELDEKIGVDCSTGPLGQGLTIAVGMALAEKMLASRYNKPDVKIIDNKIYALVGEGCLMEGVSFEALSLAGNLKLNNLIVVYDCNKISLDSPTNKTFNINIKQYMKSIGFEVFEVEDGNDLVTINNALSLAKKSDKPAMVIVKTKIGYLTKHENSNKAHGMVLDDNQLAELKQKLNIKTTDNFELEKEVMLQLEIIKARFSFVQSNFENRLKKYKRLYPNEFASLNNFINNNYKSDYKKSFDYSKVNDNLSSRDMGGIILNEFAKSDNSIVGGCADVSSSTKAYITEGGEVANNSFIGKNILYGVREFAMSCISAGLAIYGFKPFASTFLVFADYMKSSIRLNALMGLPVTYVLTHDSVMVGEDGPTHQPVEQIESLRNIPHLNVYRPCSFTECLESYAQSFSIKSPSAIVLSRQQLVPITDANYKDIEKGGYIISSEGKGKVDAVIIATGSEVKLAIEAQNKLKDKKLNIRVVSMLSQEIFDKQTKSYKHSVLGKHPVVAVEAGCSKGWYKYAHAVVGVNDFGNSTKGEDLFQQFEITSEKVISTVKEVIKNLK